MYVGSYEKAMKQAQANANLNRKPWQVFAHGVGPNVWHCEPYYGHEARIDGSTLVMPEHKWEPDFSEGEPSQSSRVCGVCGLEHD